MSPAKKKPAPKTPAPKASEIQAFSGPQAWAAWLKRQHAKSDGVWIRFYRKASGVATISHDDALDEALCWGWIDAQAKPFDAQSWLQRFTPRRPRSAWSKRNREHYDRLCKASRMQPSGQAQVDAAKADGRWAQAYDAPSQSQVPADFLAALARFKRAEAFYRTLNRANQFAISYRLQTAKKPETRQRRFEAILQMMKDGKKFH